MTLSVSCPALLIAPVRLPMSLPQDTISLLALFLAENAYFFFPDCRCSSLTPCPIYSNKTQTLYGHLLLIENLLSDDDHWPLIENSISFLRQNTMCCTLDYSRCLTRPLIDVNGRSILFEKSHLSTLHGRWPWLTTNVCEHCITFKTTHEDRLPYA